ncbi:MAG: Fe-Mn family superoxide dismutase [Sulfurifustaceae bacterium]
MSRSTYEMQPLACDPARLSGLSERLIRSHYDNNYGGAVRRLNSIRAHLAQLDWNATPNFSINGLKREELIAANSAFLHELYFDALGSKGELRPGGLSVAMGRDFGSFERWQQEFIALAKAMGGGSGWAVLSWSSRENRLLNCWGADHTHGLSAATPLLALDMYEHAYHLDYGADAAAYVTAFMRNVDWEKVNARYSAAVARDAVDFATSGKDVHDRKAELLLLDVRRAGAFQAAPEMIAGASWRDPERVEEWAAALPRAQPVVVYCVYGHEVGQSTAAILRSKGIDAKYLVGGIQGWKAAGLPMERKAPST